MQTHSFTYDAPASRVVFGNGSLTQLAAEIERLGITRAFILTTNSQITRAEHLAAQLGPRSAGVYTQIVQHVPIEAAQAARVAAAQANADGCIALGGGSAIGFGKAIALTSDLPIIAIPTTYSGSEMTSIWGLTEGGVKRTGRDRRVLPRTVIYDPELTSDLPARVAGPSGMNAIAHCLEALYAPDSNPITTLMAQEGMRALAESLPLVANPTPDPAARTAALYGAWLAGSALGMVAMGLHHKLCHTLGGRYNLPHAELHTVILPYAAAYNQAAAPAAYERAAQALGGSDVPGLLYDLARAVGAPASLQALGLRAESLDEAADLATAAPYPNPAPITRAGVRALLEAAFAGQRPV